MSDSTIYGYVTLAQQPPSNRFFVMKAQRLGSDSWTRSQLEGLVKHCEEYFADKKSQGDFFARENGVSIEGESSWDV
jgi:hypothetical protein